MNAQPFVSAPDDETAPAADLQELLRQLEAQLRRMRSRVSEAQGNTIYAAAYNLMQSGADLQRATSLLATLVALKPDVAKYWHALGICQRRRKNHAQAVHAFGQAAELAPERLDYRLLMLQTSLLAGLSEGVGEELAALVQQARDRGDTACGLRAEGLLELARKPLQ